MAADLHIHILKGIEESDLAAFNSNTLGSKYFNPRTVDQTDFSIYDKIGDTPNVWVGEVSWLKAALFEDAAEFVPSAVEAIHGFIGEDLPVIDDELIDKVASAFALANTTQYKLENDEKVIEFLRQHKGERAFTVSW
jgi:hypothetical protein